MIGSLLGRAARQLISASFLLGAKGLVSSWSIKLTWLPVATEALVLLVIISFAWTMADGILLSDAPEYFGAVAIAVGLALLLSTIWAFLFSTTIPLSGFWGAYAFVQIGIGAASLTFIWYTIDDEF